MKRLSFIVAIGLFVALCGMGPAWAEASKDEKNLKREAKRLNDTTAKPDGEKAVVKKLAAEFKMSEAQIAALRVGDIDYGEIAIILSLSQKMPGGATDANAQKVLALRQGPPVVGWGEVARQLGVKLGKTVSQVKKMSNDANRVIKKNRAQAGKAGTAAQKEPPQEQLEKETPKQEPYKGDGRLLPQGSGAL